MPTKFSQFQAGTPIVDTDQVVGFNTDNKRWTASQLKAYIGQVVTSWNGSTVPVNVTAGTGVSITNGVISFTGDANVDLQDAYNNSADGNTNLVAGKEVTWTSTEVGIRPPAMTLAQANSMVTPSTGSTVFIIDDHRLANNRGTPATPDIEKVAYLSDIPVIVNDGAYAELSLQNNTTETVIITPGVPVQIAGTYVLGPFSGFSNFGGQGNLTYTGVETRVFKVSFTITTTADLNAVDVTASIGLNGVAVPSSQQTEYLGSTTSAEHVINVQALIQLSTNDTLTCLIQNNTNTDNILVSSLNFTPTSIGGTSNVTNDQVVISWDGSTNQVAVTAGTNMDITAGVISTTAEPNVVTEWNGSTAPVQITAGTDIDITNGIISYTGGGGGGGGPSGNYQLYEMTESSPGNFYNYQYYFSIIYAGLGDNTINPNQLNIGEQAILEFTFELDPVNVTTVPAVSGSFRWTFGPYFYEMGEMILSATTTPRHGTFKYTVTRINQTEVTIDVNGYYVDGTGALKPLLGNPGLVPNTFAYNQNNSYLMAVEYILIKGTAQEYLNVIPLNLTIEQHTSRTGGGSGIVTSWDGSTNPVAVTAGAGIDITNGVITNTGGGGGGAQSGNFNIGTCLVPRTSFQYGVYQSIIDQLQGTQTIAPASLAVGESVKMRFTYELNPTLPTLSTISGSFQYVFGNTILNPPPNINLILSNTAQRTGFVEYTVTRTAVGEVTLDATGWYIETNPVDFSATMPSHTGLFTTTLPYDENLSYLFDVQWAYVSGDVNNYLDVKALNLMIDQHTQRVGAGGTQVVESWNGGTAPVDVTAGNNISIVNGQISTTAEANVVTSWDGSTAPLAVTAGSGINISGGVISSTGLAATENKSFFTTLLPSDNYVAGVYTPVWFTSTGSNTIPANTWNIGDTFQIDIIGEFVTRGTVADTPAGSNFRLSIGTNQILSNNLDTPLIIDGQVRVKPFNFSIKFTRIQDIVQPTWTVSGNGFYVNLSDQMQYITLQTQTLYNIDVTIQNIINLEFVQNHTVGNTYDFQCVQLNMMKFAI
jgi:hypothetical protein